MNSLSLDLETFVAFEAARGLLAVPTGVGTDNLQPQRLKMLGPLEPYIGAVYQAKASWEAIDFMVPTHLRIWGDFDGRPWDRLTAFHQEPQNVGPGQILDITYTITVE